MPKNPSLDLRPYFLSVDDLDGPIDWPAYFGNGNPVELDIGCGRGLFLVSAGLANPHINYLGLELDYHEGRRGAKRIWKRQMPNVRVLGGDARVAIKQLIPPHSVASAHVYFPDPWWKRRHKRRRLFTDKFADQLVEILKPDGLVHSWTDVEDYFHVISAIMDHHPHFTALPPAAERSPMHDMDYQTSFERKKRQAGLTIHRGLWRRK